MKRRDFSACILGASLATAGLSAQAQSPFAITEADYTRVSPPLPTAAGKIEVLEFFWYGCQHCFAFQALIHPWVKTLPADVLFKRVPVAFNPNFVIHQRLYYALEALDKLEELHGKVFLGIHTDKLRLDKDDMVIDFMVKNGLDKARFTEAFNAFAVSTKAKQATRLAESYKIEGVPTLGIHGRYITSGSHTGSHERALRVADTLIQRARKPT